MQKLELTWIGKGQEPAVEPRILLHTPDRDYGDPTSENMLIHGDNLLALKALEQEFAGQVKCIYIDPPYNTGSAFEHYDDNLEHSTWLSLMVPRLRILRNLLSEDGSIWISIDDEEYAYLKVLCDEIFGRTNYKTTISWQRKYSVSNNFKGIATICEYIVVYAKSSLFLSNLLPRTDESTARYQNPDDDPRGPWKAVDYLNQATTSQRPNLCYDIVNPITGATVKNGVKAWKYDRTTHQRHVDEARLWWGLSGENSVPALKLFLSEVRNGMTPHNWWPHEVAGHTDEAKKESIALFGGASVFSTPKPERLIERIFTLGSNPGDLVLDSFLGSGTTAAVAHKMGRRYIGIELGDHCYTHCLPRLKAVVDGEQGGISKAQNWQGGGGFKFYELASTLIVKDSHGQPVISDQYNPQMLVAAIAKLNGFAYAPDSEVFWKQGRSQDSSYIYVTTQYLTAAQLDDIAGGLSDFERLLICAPAFDIGLGKRYDNINVRKIPQSVLSKCEYGVDNYNLNIVRPPELDEEEWEDA